MTFVESDCTYQKACVVLDKACAIAGASVSVFLFFRIQLCRRAIILNLFDAVRLFFPFGLFSPGPLPVALPFSSACIAASETKISKRLEMRIARRQGSFCPSDDLFNRVVVDCFQFNGAQLRGLGHIALLV